MTCYFGLMINYLLSVMLNKVKHPGLFIIIFLDSSLCSEWQVKLLKRGLEPPSLTAYEPQSYMYTSSITWAYFFRTKLSTYVYHPKIIMFIIINRQNESFIIYILRYPAIAGQATQNDNLTQNYNLTQNDYYLY